MKKITTYLKNIFQRKDITGLSILGHGHHFDWKVLLSAFLLTIVGVLSFSVHVYLGVKAGDLFQAQGKADAPEVLINRAGLDQVLQVFDARAQKLKDLQAQEPVLVDPSL